VIRHIAPLPRRPGGGMWPSHPGGAWTPALLSGKLLWLRGDLGATIVSSKVTTWADQSGSGNDLAALGAGSTQPIQTTWAAGNGATAMYFDGNDRLATAANILPTSNGAGFTIFAACSFDDTNFRCAVLTNGTSGGIALAQNGSSSGKITRWKLGVAFDDDGNAVTTPLNVVMVDQVGATPGSVMYINGSIVSTTSANGQIGTPSGLFYLGASATTNFFKGYIGELVVVSGRASAGTIALWNTYSLARYGV
jgi:hypothetical protein